MKFKRGDHVKTSGGIVGVVIGDFRHDDIVGSVVLTEERNRLIFNNDALELAPYDRAEAAVRTLERMGYTHDGGEFWEHPNGNHALNVKDDWIEWPGGECPVEPDTVVAVGHRNGAIGGTVEAREWNWCHSNNPFDIVRYRVKEQK